MLTLNDGTYLNVPLTGVAQNSTAVGSVSPATATFSNQTVGTTSAPQTVTITNTGSSGLTLNTITLSPPSFTTNNFTLPVTILAGNSLPVSVYYTPSEVTTETGAIDFTFGSVPDLGTSLTGNGVAASAVTISTNPTLPQATQSAAYQYTLATTTLATPLTVIATVNGTPAAGVTVTFNDGGAGGSFGTPVATTDSNGLASTTYTLPNTAKAVTVTAAALGYTSASFNETSAVLTLTPTAGNNQSGPAGSPLPTPLTVTATNNGTPVSGVSVTFSDGGAGGSFGTPVVTTGSAGTASTTHTPGSVGTFTITASSASYTSGSFNETGSAGVASLGLVSGGKQSGTVGTTLPLPIVVKAKNSTGGIVAGASISFSDGAGGTFSPNPAVTGSNGQASTSYTLPKSPKTYTVTASVGSITTKVSETAVVGPPAIFTIAGGNNQTANPNTTLPKQLAVELTDQYKNPISGATVPFTDNGAGGTFSTTTPTTNKQGQASVTYTTGSQAGTVTITASTSGVTSLTLKETVK